MVIIMDSMMMRWFQMVSLVFSFLFLYRPLKIANLLVSIFWELFFFSFSFQMVGMTKGHFDAANENCRKFWTNSGRKQHLKQKQVQVWRYRWCCINAWYRVDMHMWSIKVTVEWMQAHIIIIIVHHRDKTIRQRLSQFLLLFFIKPFNELGTLCCSDLCT